MWWWYIIISEKTDTLVVLESLYAGEVVSAHYQFIGVLSIFFKLIDHNVYIPEAVFHRTPDTKLFNGCWNKTGTFCEPMAYECSGKWKDERYI